MEGIDNMGTIKKLYVDYISLETPSQPTHKEYYEKLCKVRLLEERFISKLSGDTISLFEELMYNKLDCENDKINEAFVDGYKMGSLLMMDILT